MGQELTQYGPSIWKTHARNQNGLRGANSRIVLLNTLASSMYPSDVCDFCLSSFGPSHSLKCFVIGSAQWSVAARGRPKRSRGLFQSTHIIIEREKETMKTEKTLPKTTPAVISENEFAWSNPSSGGWKRASSFRPCFSRRDEPTDLWCVITENKGRYGFFETFTFLWCLIWRYAIWMKTNEKT